MNMKAGKVRKESLDTLNSNDGEINLMDNQNIRVKERVQESLIKNPTDYTIEEVIKLYPKYLTFTGSKNFFVTPLLLNKYDLMFERKLIQTTYGSNIE